MTWETKRVLVTVKAAPEPSAKYHEGVVCTAGITEEGEFIRLYPVPFPLFYRGDGPAKFEWIEVECQKATEKLMRKESYKIRPGSEIKIIDSSLSSKGGRRFDWRKRNELVFPLRSGGIEELREAFDADRTSLGLVRVKDLIDFYERESEDESVSNTKRYMQAVFDQTANAGALSTVPILDKVAHVYAYKFTCEGERCRSHDMTCLDWELSEAIRSWRYTPEEFPGKLRQKFYDQFKKTDLHFFMGTTSQQPSWVIIGTYRPPKPND